MTQGSAKCESPGANFYPRMVCARRRFGRKRNWLLKAGSRQGASQTKRKKNCGHHPPMKLYLVG
jgi:hypothetical protein